MPPGGFLRPEELLAADGAADGAEDGAASSFCSTTSSGNKERQPLVTSRALFALTWFETGAQTFNRKGKKINLVEGCGTKVNAL